jgi:ubiquinone/menaquinone biosynthesis C-methylase UbiE
LKKGVVAENLFGIDLLPERIKEAKRQYPSVYFTCGNAESLHYPDELFDIIIQSTTFTSILDKKMKKGIASEMIRVLKSNGVIIWHDYRFSNPLNRNAKGIDKDEIMSLFPNCSFSFKSVNLNPLIARPLARLSFRVCEILEKIRILRTHLLVVIRKNTHVKEVMGRTRSRSKNVLQD